MKIAEGMKRCSKCGEVKPVGEFYKHKNRKDGLQSQCKQCQKEYIEKYYEENKEHCAEKAKKYREENKGHCAEYSKKNIVMINNEAYNINTAPEEIKVIVEFALQTKALKNIAKKIKKERSA